MTALSDWTLRCIYVASTEKCNFTLVCGPNISIPLAVPKELEDRNKTTESTCRCESTETIIDGENSHGFVLPKTIHDMILYKININISDITTPGGMSGSMTVFCYVSNMRLFATFITYNFPPEGLGP